jgi:CheY-like chemotaxis protein
MREPAEPFSILLVEDDRATADMYASALRLDGCSVQIAGDGWCGLRVAQQHAPDLLLLDVHLPGLDGHSVLSVLRRYGDTWSPPAIMLSNETSPDVLQRSMELGAVAHLVKCETTPAELCSVVRTCRTRPAMRLC